MLRGGDPAAALGALRTRVRGAPENAELRVFLFQLLCIEGEWERARDQLKVIAELSPGALPLAHVYGAAVACELLRRDVFAGTRTPLVMGEPLPWLALLLQSLAAQGQGRASEATAVRAQALEDAVAVPGTIDGKAFEWIADADSRIGPVCEAIIDGRYYWVPFERIAALTLEAPSDLRDVVWARAQLRLANAGEIAALIPARYPGSERDPDAAIRLARRTEWSEVTEGAFHGRGQRMLATESGEFSLLDVRRIELTPVDR